MAKFMKTVDGNTAAAHVSYSFTDVAAIYPMNGHHRVERTYLDRL